MTAALSRLKTHCANWRAWELNPIVIKELRQAVRSMAVLGMLHLFLIVLFITAVTYLAMSGVNSSEGATQLGSEIFQAFLLILAGASMVFIPLYVGIRLAVERQPNNPDLLYISTLPPGRIIRGKFFCGAYMTVLFFSACMPFMAFTNFLRGVDLPSMFVVLLYLFVVVCAMNMVAIFLACLPMSTPFKVLLALYGVFQGLVLVAPVVFGSIELMREGVGMMIASRTFWLIAATVVGLGLLAVGLLYFLSVALISPVSANRALPIKLYITAVWLLTAGLSVCWVLRESNAWLMLPWAIISYLILTAALLVVVSGADELSHRVRRDIPRGPRRRLLAFVFYNGTAGGLLWVGALMALTWLGAGVVITFADFGSTAGLPYDFDGQQLFPLKSGAIALYTLCYALTGMFLQRRFLPRRTPKLAGLFAIILAGVWAVAPNAVLFFSSQLSLQAMERFQPGSIPNLFVIKEPTHFTLHLACCGGWLVVMLVLYARSFRNQFTAFQPLEKSAPPVTAPPPLPS